MLGCGFYCGLMHKYIVPSVVLSALVSSVSCTSNMSSVVEQRRLPVPERGFVSSQPAGNWEEGLITGNGILGLNALSHPNEERIIFNHEELFMPMGKPFVPPDQSADLPKIRQLIAEGKYKEADRKSVV